MPAGRLRFRRAREVAQRLQEEVLTALPTEEKERFLENLALLAEGCRTAAERE